MANSQTNRASGLLVHWDRQHGEGPLNHRLAQALKEAIRAAEISPGDRLPASRVLAEGLGVSRWVVTEAYVQLVGEGYLRSTAGSGTFVSPDVVPDRKLTIRTPKVGALGSSGVMAPPERSRTVGLNVDLWPTLPDLTAFPRAAWRSAHTWAIQHCATRDLGYPPSEGTSELRDVLSRYLRRVRGLAAEPEATHITSGTASAIASICRMLRNDGVSTVAVEDPGWLRTSEIAHQHGLQVTGVPVDREGMRVPQLWQHKVGAVFVTPAHQFPLGITLSPPRRTELVHWARTTGGFVIEDDYDAEFRYDRRPVGAIAALSAEHVIYIGSCSKTLSPALRLGWIVAPRRLQQALRLARAANGSATPTLEQLALARLIDTGAYDRHVRRMLKSYRSRRIALLTALQGGVPGEAWPSLDAGLHILWMLPPQTSEPRLQRAAEQSGQPLLTLGECRIRAGRPGLVIGFGNVPEREAPRAAQHIAHVVERATRNR